MQKPLNKDIYKILQYFEGETTALFVVEEISKQDQFFILIYKWLISNAYLSVEKRERKEIKTQYEDEIDQSYTGEEWVTIKGKSVPDERFDKKSEEFVVLTTEGKMFLNNYSKFWKRINYWFEDYNIVMPLLFGFLGGIVSSLILYFLVGK